MNRAINQYPNTGFDRGLSLLSQSLTGYDWTPSRDLDHNTIKHHAEIGRKLRSQAFRQALRGLTKAIVNTGGKAIEALKHQHLRRTSIRQLAALSDYQLNDIGLIRAEIPATVERLLRNEPRSAAKPKSVVTTVSAPTKSANDEASKLAA